MAVAPEMGIHSVTRVSAFHSTGLDGHPCSGNIMLPYSEYRDLIRPKLRYLFGDKSERPFIDEFKLLYDHTISKHSCLAPGRAVFTARRSVDPMR